MSTYGVKQWTDRVEQQKFHFGFCVLCGKAFCLSVCSLSLALPDGVYEAQHQGPRNVPPLLEVWVTAWKQCGQGQSLPLVRLESDSQTVLWEWSILGWPCFPWEMRLNWGTTSWPVLCPDISWERCQGLHLGICFCLKVWDFFVDFWGFWLCLFY